MQIIIDDDEVDGIDEQLVDANEQQIYVILFIECLDLHLPLDEIVVILVMECVYIDLHLIEHLLL